MQDTIKLIHRRRENVTEKIFAEMMAENYPTLMKDVHINIQQTNTQREMKSKRSTPRHTIIKLSKDKEKENLRNSKTEVIHHIEEILNEITSRFHIRNFESQRQLVDRCKVLKE